MIGWGSSDPLPYNDENIMDYFEPVGKEIIGKDEDGDPIVRLVVKRKKDKTGKSQKAADGAIAIIAKLFGL